MWSSECVKLEIGMSGDSESIVILLQIFIYLYFISYLLNERNFLNLVSIQEHFHEISLVDLPPEEVLVA